MSPDDNLHPGYTGSRDIPEIISKIDDLLVKNGGRSHEMLELFEELFTNQYVEPDNNDNEKYIVLSDRQRKMLELVRDHIDISIDMSKCIYHILQDGRFPEGDRNILNNLIDKHRKELTELWKEKT